PVPDYKSYELPFLSLIRASFISCLIQSQVAQQQRQADQCQGCSTKNQSNRAFAQILLYLTFWFPGNKKSLFAVALHNHVLIMSIACVRVLHTSASHVILFAGQDE